MYLLSINGSLTLYSSRSALVAAIRSLESYVSFSVYWSIEGVGSSEARFNKLSKASFRKRFPELVESGDI